MEERGYSEQLLCTAFPRDLDIDSDGDYWLTNSKSAYGRGLIDFYYPTNPMMYFVCD